VIYLDTSLLLKLYADEHGSREVAERLVGVRGIVCSRHGRLELLAALKRHQREARLDRRGLRQSIAMLEADERDRVVEWLPVGDGLIDAACRRLVDMPPGMFLRAADALHLACASEAGLKEIHSHDRHLLAAAPHFGLKGVDLLGGRD
jgi:predicted nucleic acid-binding protein